MGKQTCGSRIQDGSHGSFEILFPMTSKFNGVFLVLWPFVFFLWLVVFFMIVGTTRLRDTCEIAQCNGLFMVNWYVIDWCVMKKHLLKRWLHTKNECKCFYILFMIFFKTWFCIFLHFVGEYVSKCWNFIILIDKPWINLILNDDPKIKKRFVWYFLF